MFVVGGALLSWRSLMEFRRLRGWLIASPAASRSKAVWSMLRSSQIFRSKNKIAGLR